MALFTTSNAKGWLAHGTVRCGLEQVTFTPCLVLVKTQEAVDGRSTWTDCDEAGDYVVPNVLSPRDLVSRPDNMDETVPHTHKDGNITFVCRYFRTR